MSHSLRVHGATLNVVAIIFDIQNKGYMLSVSIPGSDTHHTISCSYELAIELVAALEGGGAPQEEVAASDEVHEEQG